MSSDPSDLLTAVDECLRREFAQRSALLPAAEPHLSLLADQVVDCATDGKRVRSRLVLTGAGEQAHRAVPTAAAFDLLHSAFVLHDDVIDRDELRRGRPTLHHAGAEHYRTQGWPEGTATHRGYARGIVAGDLALSISHSLLHRAAGALDPETGHRLVQLFETTVLATTAGELMDIELSLPPLSDSSPTGGSPTGDSPTGGSPSTAAAMEVAALKTARYTVAAPLTAGGIVGGLPEPSTDALHRIGTVLGTAFQLQDDLLGTFGTPERTGKPTWGDLREGRPTYLLATALRSPHDESIRDLLTRLADTEDKAPADADLEALRSLIHETGAVDATRQQITDLTDQASTLIDSAELPGPLTRSLRQLQSELAERHS